MLKIYCRVQPCTDFTRVHVENQTCSRDTVECNGVHISHVYILKIKVILHDALSIYTCHPCQCVACVSACGRRITTLPPDHMHLLEVATASPRSSTSF